MFTVLRKTAWADASMQSGKWEKAKFMGSELSEKTVGIVGFTLVDKII